MAEIIQDLTLLLLVSLPINLLFHKIKWPSVSGYLVAGVLIGPHGLGWIADPESVERLAEIGVLLLMFVIGLEFSLGHLLREVGRILGAAALQMGLTTLAVGLVASRLGYSGAAGWWLGILTALSSTAVVLKMIIDRVEIDTPRGRACIGILLFQDVCVLPLMLLTPLLGGREPVSGWTLGLALLKSAAAVGGMFFVSRLAVPRALGTIARTGTREHLTLFVILLILGTGWLAEQVGLSLAMGAFIAGIILSESEYQHQISLDILPVKDYFGSIFFISVGMLLDLQVLAAGWERYALLVLGLIGLKSMVAGAAARVTRHPWPVALGIGIYLAQTGEFSLILAAEALEHGLLSAAQHQEFLIVAVLSMLAAPLLIQWGAAAIQSRGEPPPPKEPAPAPETPSLAGHVIIAGYSMIGRHLARVLHEVQIPFLVVEQSGEKLKEAMTHQAPVLYGDSTRRDTLLRAGIQRARMLVVSLPHLKSADLVVRLARLLNPDLYILVRTDSEHAVDELTRAGANLVIPEEFETSIEIFSRVLREYRIPNHIIEQQVELVRMEGYSMFRGFSLNAESLAKFSTYLAATLTESLQVEPGHWVAGRRVGELKLHQATGARLIAIVKQNTVYPNPDPDSRVEAGDVLILFGRHAPLFEALRYVRAGPAPAPGKEAGS